MKISSAAGIIFKRIVSFVFIFLCLSIKGLLAQDQKIADSLKLIYEQDNVKDTTRLELLKELSFHEIRDLKMAIKYAEELITLAEADSNIIYLQNGYYIKGTKERLLSNMDKALASFIKSAELSEALHSVSMEGESYLAIADIYSMAGNRNTSTQYYARAITMLQNSKGSLSFASALLNAGDEFLKAKKYDTALLYAQNAQFLFDSLDYEPGKGYGLGNIGMVYAKTGKYNLAEKYLTDAITILEANEDYQASCDYLLGMSDVYLQRNDFGAALNAALKSLDMAGKYGLNEQVLNANLKLSEIYEKTGNSAKALEFYKAHISGRDSVNNFQTVQKMADLRTNFEVARKQAEVDLLNQQKRNQKNILISMAIILTLAVAMVSILFRNNQQRQKAYSLLKQQKQATDEQRGKAENALAELLSIQKRLIHSAKMASLGEVTAGVAHEIQNPLNFVNNFSEVNIEMLEELREYFLKKLEDPEKTAANELMKSIEDNLTKINYHGNRADAIVKGMLQHSKGSTGEKVAVDINALVDEALRLSYTGQIAKTKDGKINLTTDFDKSIGKATVVPQDISRVLLNLCNNAFYAVNQKKQTAGADFEPSVLVSTKKLGNKIRITVKDNGNGIPQNLLDKIFQPFFTTKPTGQGTGLGLSLSYDIVKFHDGELKVETEEGAFSEFIIELPAGNQV